MTTILSRRELLLRTLAAAGSATAPAWLVSACSGNQAALRPARAASCAAIGDTPLPIPCGPLANIGPLQEPDENGLRLPAGFTSRLVAISGKPVAGTDYIWHANPDGAATYPTDDGGWILAVNSESTPGGVGAIRFDAAANITDAYRILDNTRNNCAGGPTPWGTWLSCEEVTDGLVYECDPYGCEEAKVKPLLGAFSHEAVAVDPVHKALYLTEDFPLGHFYRFRPSASDWPEGSDRAALEDGVLEAAVLASSPSEDTPVAVSWLPIADPSQLTQLQAASATVFNGGEGIWFHDGLIFFTTKGDNRVWLFDTDSETLLIVYDQATSENPILSGADNVVISCFGDVLVAEDGGDMQLVLITPDREIIPFLQFDGQPGSEVTGPCFSPDGKRLYVNSQRGPAGQSGVDSASGATYEITGFERVYASQL